MEYEYIQDLGIRFREIILFGADLLREEWTPGAVSLGIVGLALVVVIYLGFRDWQRARALAWARRVVSTAENRKDFAQKFIEVDRAFNLVRDSNRRWPASIAQREDRRPLGVAWGEYRETMVVPAPGSGGVVRNSLRPGAFINAEDLGFETRWWRIWPGLFVSVGLLLTFLGLIAALTAIGGDEITDDSLRELLNAASAKFIMSLTGLACSIVLTVVGRSLTNLVEERIRALCHALEKRLHFQSLEEIAEEQLATLKEQGTTMRKVAMEMVAELSRPLREELPTAIGASIKAELAPLLETLRQTSKQGVGELVGDLSQRLSGDIGDAMAMASGRLGEAADRLAALAERMESGTGRIGQEYESLVARMGSQLTEMQKAMQSEVASGQKAMSEGTERLMQQMNESLDAIRSNTSQGAQAIADAAAEMRAAAEGFRQEVESATGKGAAAVDAQMQSAAQAAGASIASATVSLTDPLVQLAERLQAAAQATQSGADGLARLAEAARSGGDAIARGSDRFEVATGAIAGAAEPIRVGIDGLRATSRDMADGLRQTMETVSKHSEATARQTRDALDTSTRILGDQHRGISRGHGGASRGAR